MPWQGCADGQRVLEEADRAAGHKVKGKEGIVLWGWEKMGYRVTETLDLCYITEGTKVSAFFLLT